MERASFADYINMKDHELETLREKIIKMTAEELKNHRQQNRTQIKTGEVEMLRDSSPLGMGHLDSLMVT